MNRRPSGARVIARRVATPPQTLRFPCGHLEDQRFIDERRRETPRAAWVACRRCNLIVVATAEVPIVARPTATHQ